MTPRKVIFWSHLLAGTIAGLVIFLMSFTGVVLMYAPQILVFAERKARQITPPAADAQRLTLDQLMTKVRESNPEVRLAGLMLRSDPGTAVSIGFGREGTLYVDPYTGSVLGQGSKIREWLHTVEDWHRWLGMGGENRAIGKAVSGACNLAFFWLAVTGVYLWWPHSWKWRGLKSSLIFNARLRGKARDWNWHNVIGFWSSSVLIILTLTASVMSYNWANDLLYTLTGSEPPRRIDGPGNVAPRARGRGAGQNLETRKASASLDALVIRSQQQVPGWVMIMMRFSPRGDGPVTASILGPDAWHPFQRSQLTLDQATAAVVKWEPYSSNSVGRKLRTWVRALHTGEAFGIPGQTVAGLASLGGCFLVWTGLSMAWRRFRSWRHPPVDTMDVIPPLEYAGLADAAAGQLAVAEESPLLSEAHVHSGPESSNGHAHELFPVVDPPCNGDTSLLILYGTVTGNAESLAHRLGRAVERLGFNVRVSDMATCEAGVLTPERYVLIVTSTFGDGEPPDDAAPFWEAVVHGNGLDLRGVKYSVLALGNSTYDHFCRCGRELDAALERHGATRLYPRVDCDAEYDVPAKRWTDGVLTSLERDTGASAAI